MHFTLVNLLSALAIGIIIGWMARIPNVRLKAAIYTLPIPISIALLATHPRINSSEIIGLLLVCGFIWLTKLLHETFRITLLLADVLAAMLYVAVGYIFIRLVHVNFPTALTIYITFWLVLIRLFRKHPSEEKSVKPSTISPLTKGTGTTLISFIMFSLKDALAGIVVTFPFSGVFAVAETKGQLGVFFRVVVRNSLAIIGLFVSMYALQIHLNLIVNLTIGWAVYFVILKLVQRVTV
jgi:hypothetical protein